MVDLLSLKLLIKCFTVAIDAVYSRFSYYERGNCTVLVYNLKDNWWLTNITANPIYVILLGRRSLPKREFRPLSATPSWMTSHVWAFLDVSHASWVSLVAVQQAKSSSWEVLPPFHSYQSLIWSLQCCASEG